MADYYSILEKTISGLPNNTPDVRKAVYKKAKVAIETQLRNMNPSPSEEAIGSQLMALEKAIVLIDAKYAEPVVPQEVAPLEPEPTPVELESAPIPPSPSPAPSAVDGAVTATSAVERVEAAIDTINTEVPENVNLEAPVEVQQVPNTPPPAPVASIEMPQGPDTPPATAELGSVSVDPTTKNIVEPILNAENNNQASTIVDIEEKKSGGFFSGLIKLLVALGILGGAGYAIWKNKDELPEPVGNFIESTFGKIGALTNDEVPEPTPAPEVTDNITPEPVVPEVTEPVVVETEPEPEPVVVEPEPVVVEPEPVVVEPEVVEPEVVEPEVVEPEIAPEETTTNNQQNGVIPIGEVAYLYEEGSAGSGATRTNAAITWETRQETLKESLSPELVIIGKMDIPEKAMSIDIKIKRNIDEAVSASHLIELQFKVPPDFSGKSVESIARFVMKATEEAPGDPLVAVPVKVGEGNFLIALDNLQQAVTLNTQLLKESSWIDVPVVYGTGKRALITLEKGGTGERVFNEALKDWQNR